MEGLLNMTGNGFKGMKELIPKIINDIETNAPPLETKSNESEDNSNSSTQHTEVNTPIIEPKHQSLESNTPLEEVITPGTMRKKSFTVSIDSRIDDKFNAIWSYYQSKSQYGKVYKTEVLQIIIDEVYKSYKRQRLID